MAQLSTALASLKAPSGSEKWSTRAGMTSRTTTTVGTSSLRAFAACSSVMPGTTCVVRPSSEPLAVPDANLFSSYRVPRNSTPRAPERFSVHLRLRAGLHRRLHALVRVRARRGGDPGGERPLHERRVHEPHPGAVLLGEHLEHRLGR